MRLLFSTGLQAWRSWRRSFKRNGLSSVGIILVMAIAVGASTALFRVMVGVLTVVPFPEPDRIVTLWNIVNVNKTSHLRLSMPEYFDYNTQSGSFSSLSLLSPDFHNVRVGNHVELSRTHEA